MVLEVWADHVQAMQTHAESAYPYECCGLLLGQLYQERKVLVEVWTAENAWNAKTANLFGASGSIDRHYAIAPEVLLNAQRYGRDRGLKVIGIYHSHPDHLATPSKLDQDFAWPQYSYMIVSVHKGKFQDLQCWTLNPCYQFQPEAIAVVEPAPFPITC